MRQLGAGALCAQGSDLPAHCTVMFHPPLHWLVAPRGGFGALAPVLGAF